MAEKAKKVDVFIANESGACQLGDDHYTFVKGVTRIRAGHPLLEANPQYFEPVDESVHYDIEHATSAPGEKRGQK